MRIRFKKYVTEMPHLEYGIDKHIDLMFEIRNSKQVVKEIEDILAGKEYKDKYGSVAKLSEPEKFSFAMAVRNDNFIQLWVKKHNIEKQLEQILSKYLGEY